MASSYYLDSKGRRWGKGGTPSILEMFISFEYSSIRKTQDLFLPFSSLCTSGYGVIYLTDKSGNNLYAHLSLSSRSGGWVPPIGGWHSLLLLQGKNLLHGTVSLPRLGFCDRTSKSAQTEVQLGSLFISHS